MRAGNTFKNGPLAAGLRRFTRTSGPFQAEAFSNTEKALSSHAGVPKVPVLVALIGYGESYAVALGPKSQTGLFRNLQLREREREG